MKPNPKFIQGFFDFEGRGITELTPLGVSASYTVPSDKRAQLVYMRAGNTSDHVVTLVLTRDDTPMRLFPLGARSSSHVSLAVVEDIFPESSLKVLVTAPVGVKGTVIVDFGLVEID
jgi:hypothetical protein